MKQLSILFLFVLLACGKENSDVTAGSLNLILQFPAAISKSSGKYESFLKHVEYMEIETKLNGSKKGYKFPPQKWDTLQLSDLTLPSKEGEHLEIKIAVWDRTSDGFRRSYPILLGKKTVSKSECDSKQVRIFLHAQANL